MTARFARDEMSFVMPSSFSAAQSVRVAHRPTSLTARITAMLRWLAEMPRRRAVIEELSALSDHELADIGLTRGEVVRVFDSGFAAERGAN
jgi:uncharacterized protein YjiS (DUF1127 family)